MVGKILDAKQAWDESREIIARERPEALKEGEKVPLTMLETPYKPMSPVPSGYTVEKADGKILYRDAEGKAVTRETAIRNSTGYREDRDRIRDHGA